MKTSKMKTSKKQRKSTSAISVAIFVDGLPDSQSCVAANCVKLIESALLEDNPTSPIKQITPTELENENGLRNMHVLVFPGGLEQKMKWSLSTSAIQNIQTWRHETGGGLIGICAGAVFLCAQGRRGRHLVKGVDLVQDEKFHQAGLEGLVTVEATEEAPSRVRRCVTATQRGKTEDEESDRFLYFCGPVFRVKSSKKRGKEQMGSNAVAWANYTSDLAKEELNFFAPTSHNGNTKTTKCELPASSSWVCYQCRQRNPNRKKACCGETHRDQKRQTKNMESLIGAMPGSAAIVGVEEDRGEEMVSRTVLFGPHPEFGGPFQRKLLRHALLWAAEPAIK